MKMEFKRVCATLMALLVVSVTAVVAQPGGGGGGGMGGGMGGPGGGQGREGGMQQSEVSYKIIEQAGYFELDSEDIIKKIKIKKDEETKSNIRRAVIEYTKVYEAVGQKYAKEIKAIEEAQKILDKSEGNMTNMRTTMQGIRESTQKIRTEMTVAHKRLSEVDMPAILDEKSAALWVKYYSTLCQTKGFRLNQPERRSRGEGNEGGQGSGQRQRPQM